MNKISRVLIVDDHPIVIQGVRGLISQEDNMEVCGEAGDAEGGMRAIETLRPDIVLVDLSLPGVPGLEFIKGAKSRYPDLPMLVLSMHDENIYASRALKAGALGYIMKDKSAENLVTGINSVLKGEIFVSSSIATQIMQEFATGNKKPHTDDIGKLSDRELETFRLIGKGHSTRQIADQLILSVKTIDSLKAKIKDKLHLSNSSELVQRAVLWMQSQGEL